MNNKELDELKEKLHKIDTAVQVMKFEMSNVCKKCDDVLDKMDKRYVARNEFDPVRKIVYGIVGLVLTSVGGAVIALVLK